MNLNFSQDKVAWTSEEWTPELEGLTTRYEMTAANVSAYRQLQMDWFCDGNSVSRFTSVYGGLYNVRRCIAIISTTI